MIQIVPRHSHPGSSLLVALRRVRKLRMVEIATSLRTQTPPPNERLASADARDLNNSNVLPTVDRLLNQRDESRRRSDRDGPFDPDEAYAMRGRWLTKEKKRMNGCWIRGWGMGKR